MHSVLHLNVFIRKHIQCRSDRVVSTGHDERCSLRQFHGKVFERGWNNQISRFNRNRLSVRIHLIEEELDCLIETFGGECGTCSVQHIPVSAVEQSLAVRLNRICQQPAEKKQLVD